jgi:hypothetical protein
MGAMREAPKQGPIRIEMEEAMVYFFFLCLFLRRRFLRLCVAILWRLRFFPLGMLGNFFVYNSFFSCSIMRVTPLDTTVSVARVA